MKSTLFSIVLLLVSNFAIAQTSNLSKVNTKNTWLKVGINAGAPINGDGLPFQFTNTSFVLGLDACVQFLETKASGIGFKTGYSNYFSKNDLTKDMGELPLALMYRYYPTSKGFFTGIDVGYSLMFNTPLTKGGLMGRPHVGYHGNNWNIFAYYNLIMIEEPLLNYNIQSVGISVTRNIFLSKKKKKK